MTGQDTSPIKIGDTVRLKSGGPIMTVFAIEGGDAYCEWFSGDKSTKGRFNLLTLEKAQKSVGVSSKPIRRA